MQLKCLLLRKLMDMPSDLTEKDIRETQELGILQADDTYPDSFG